MNTSLALLIFVAGASAIAVAYTKSYLKEPEHKKQAFRFSTKGRTICLGSILLVISVVLNAYSVERDTAISSLQDFIGGNLILDYFSYFLVGLIPFLSGIIFNEMRKCTSKWRTPAKRRSFFWLSIICLALFLHSLVSIGDLLVLLLYMQAITIWVICIKAQEN